MKIRKAPHLLKKIIAGLSSKTKELKIRIMIFFLLHKNTLNKSTLLTHAFSSKLNALLASHNNNNNKKNDDVLEEKDSLLLQDDDKKDGNKSSLLIHNNTHVVPSAAEEEEDEEDEVESVTDVLFQESKEIMEEDQVMSVENTVVEETEEVADAVAEEDIDKAADMFIEKFKRQIRLQKLHSIDRHQNLLPVMETKLPSY